MSGNKAQEISRRVPVLTQPEEEKFPYEYNRRESEVDFHSFTLEREIDPEVICEKEDYFQKLSFSFYNTHKKEADSSTQIIKENLKQFLIRNSNQQQYLSSSQKLNNVKQIKSKNQLEITPVKQINLPKHGLKKYNPYNNNTERNRVDPLVNFLNTQTKQLYQKQSAFPQISMEKKIGNSYKSSNFYIGHKGFNISSKTQQQQKTFEKLENSEYYEDNNQSFIKNQFHEDSLIKSKMMLKAIGNGENKVNQVSIRALNIDIFQKSNDYQNKTPQQNRKLIGQDLSLKPYNNTQNTQQEKELQKILNQHNKSPILNNQQSPKQQLVKYTTQNNNYNKLGYHSNRQLF